MRTRTNPDLFGEDVAGLLFEGFGIGLTAVVNDKAVAPITKSVAPSLTGDGTMAKLIDAGTTALSGWLLGEGVGMVDSRVGRDMKRGGILLAVARGVSAFIPGFQLSETIPLSLGDITSAKQAAPAVAGGATGSVPMLPAPSGAPVSNPSYTMNDYPRGVSPSMDVGL